ncbi:MAG: SpvB/TcaC N-terminal domain-containing protein, partial [Pseudomonadota bacterium]
MTRYPDKAVIIIVLMLILSAMAPVSALAEDDPAPTNQSIHLEALDSPGTSQTDGYRASSTDDEELPMVSMQPVLNDKNLPTSLQNTGAMTYSIPIKVAPGMGGFQPDLKLTYNSQSNRNSWVGQGWNLNLGYIERSKKKRIFFSPDDTFSFNGTAELVKRSQWGNGFYGARIESEFVKYKYLTTDDRWEVYHPDGSIYYYGSTGNTTDARLKPSAGTTTRWLLHKIVDSNKRVISVDYYPPPDAIYPKTISYQPSYTTIQFALEARNDVYSDYSNYVPVTPSKRLKAITCYGRGTQAHRYLLSYDYSNHSGRSLLKNVQEFGSDNTTGLPPVTLSYEEHTTTGFQTDLIKTTGPGENAYVGGGYADVNGDGCPDLIQGTYIALWNKNTNSFDEPKENGLPESLVTCSYVCRPINLRYGYFNSDSYADCLVIYHRKDGDTFPTFKTFLGQADGTLIYSGFYTSMLASGQLPRYSIHVADENGDGLSDLIILDKDAAGNFVARVHLAYGNGFFEPDDITIPGQPKPGGLGTELNVYGFPYMADVNGDGSS